MRRAKDVAWSMRVLTVGCVLAMVAAACTSTTSDSTTTTAGAATTAADGGGSDSGDGESGSDTTAAADGGAQSGGILRMSSSASQATVGPHVWGSRNWSVTYAIFDRLVELSEDGTELAPGLATSWDTPDEGKTWVFELREGVTFHDGAPLTANDVKYSYERVLNPDNGAPAQGTFAAFNILGQSEFFDGTASDISGLRVTDELTLEIEMEEPRGSLPFWLTMGMMSIVPMEYAAEVGYEAFEQAPIGTGPFQVDSFTPNEMLVLSRFDNYWGEPAHLDGVEWEYLVEPNIALLRIQNNEQDVMYDGIPAADLNVLRSDDTVQDRLYEAPYNNVYYMSMNLNHEAMANLEVRQAIAHAVNREKVVQLIGGQGVAADGGVFSPLSPFWQDDFPTYEYDPERARELLEEAGYEGFSVEISIKSEEPFEGIGQAVLEDLRAVGIDAELDVLAPSPWFDYVLSNPEVLVVSPWELPYPHGSYVIEGMFTTDALEGGCCNFNEFSDPGYDELTATAAAGPDFDTQVELYKQLDEQAVYDEALVVPLFYSTFAALTSCRVHGFEIPATPTGDTKFFADYWIDESGC